MKNITLVLCMQKLGNDYRIKNDPDILSKAAKHNLREIVAELHPDASSHINPARSHLNKVLRGEATSTGIVQDCEQRMREANAVVKRKDNIRGVELVFSLPNHFDGDVQACFEDFVIWVESEFKDIPILSAIAHYDEAAPHVHVILLPIIGDKLQGHRIMGNIKTLQKRRKNCETVVGLKYGITLQKPEQLSREDSLSLALSAVNDLCAYPELMRTPEIKNAIIASLAKCSSNINMHIAKHKIRKPRTPRKKTFTDIMISKVKPDNQDRYQ